MKEFALVLWRLFRRRASRKPRKIVWKEPAKLSTGKLLATLQRRCTAEDRYRITDDGIVRFERPRQAPADQVRKSSARALGSPASVSIARRQPARPSTAAMRALAASVGTIVLPLILPSASGGGSHRRHPWAPNRIPVLSLAVPCPKCHESQGAYENAILVRAIEAGKNEGQGTASTRRTLTMCQLLIKPWTKPRSELVYCVCRMVGLAEASSDFVGSDAGWRSGGHVRRIVRLTGAGGYIGTTVVPALLQAGHQVQCRRSVFLWPISSGR